MASSLTKRYVGVYELASGSFRATLVRAGTRFDLGCWPTAAAAALARDRALLHLGEPGHLSQPKRAAAAGAASPSELLRQSRVRRLGTGKAGYRGVVELSNGTFRAALAYRGERHDLGCWPTASAAALARDRAVLHLGIKDTPLNDPPASAAGPASPSELRAASLGAQRRTAPGSVDPTASGFAARCRRKHLGTWPDADGAALAIERYLLHLGNPDVRTPGLSQKTHRLGPASAKQLHLEAAVARAKARGGAVGVSRVRGRFACAVGKIPAGTWETLEQASLARDRLWLHEGMDPAGLNDRAAALKAGPASSDELKRLAGRRSAAPKNVKEHEGRWVASLPGPPPVLIGKYPTASRARRAFDAVVRGEGLDLPLYSPSNPPPPLRLKQARALARKPERDRSLPGGVQETPGGYRVVVAGVSAGVWGTIAEATLARDRLWLHSGHNPSRLHDEARARVAGPATAAELRSEAAALKHLRPSMHGCSQYRGVWKTETGAFRATLRLPDRRVHLGTFASAEEAARAWDRACWAVRRDRDLLNFTPPSGRLWEPPPRRPKRAPAGLQTDDGGLTWRACITAAGRYHHLGRWQTQREASLARDRAILYLGTKTKLTAPEDAKVAGPCSPESLRRLARAARKRAKKE